MTLEEDLTFEEQKAIEELKKRTIEDLTPKLLEDSSLFYRFLKARNFNLKDAESMLRKHIAWRKEYGIDTVLSDFKAPEALKKYTPSSIVGFDKEGCPVRYIDVGGGDSKGLFKSAKRVDLIKHNLCLIEEDMLLLQEQSNKLKKSLLKVVYIYDFKDFTFVKATHKETLEMMMLGINMYQDNYPERIKSIYVINTSVYYSLVFSVVKIVIAQAVLDKIHLFGTDGWKEALLKIIDPNELPAFLGGNKTDPDGDPLCKSFVNHGTIVPERYYLRKSKKTLYQEPGVKKLTVTRFSSTNINFDVKEPNSILEWEFETKNRDIAFGVYFKDNKWDDSKPIALVPKQRIDTWTEPETGMYKCEKSGSYTIVFDNSYSWIYPKEIYYRAVIVPPDNKENQ